MKEAIPTCKACSKALIDFWMTIDPNTDKEEILDMKNAEVKATLFYAIPIGKQIRSIRKRKGITQERLAEITDIKQEGLSRIERGKTIPTIPTLLRIGRALKVELVMPTFNQDKV
jgi:DNA-binding XRE family transcriptional regulator